MALGGTSSFEMFQNLNILVYLGWTDWAFNYTKYIPLINYFFISWIGSVLKKPTLYD